MNFYVARRKLEEYYDIYTIILTELYLAVVIYIYKLTVGDKRMTRNALLSIDLNANILKEYVYNIFILIS